MLRVDVQEDATDEETLALHQLQPTHLRPIARLGLLAQVKISEDKIEVIHDQFLHAHFPAHSS